MFAYDPHSRAAGQYVELAEWVLGRVAALRQPTHEEAATDSSAIGCFHYSIQSTDRAVRSSIIVSAVPARRSTTTSPSRVAVTRRRPSPAARPS